MKTINVMAEDAFGPYRNELVTHIDRDKIPSYVKLSVGQQLQLQESDGSAIIVTVKEINDKKAILDANHPLAGKDIIFDIELLEILNN
jgi:peptidylprolyl isomerase